MRKVVRMSWAPEGMPSAEKGGFVSFDDYKELKDLLSEVTGINAGMVQQHAELLEKNEELEREQKELVYDCRDWRIKYQTLLEDVRGACGCTDGDDIRSHLEEYLAESE